jgi:hypothetical protein
MELTPRRLFAKPVDAIYALGQNKNDSPKPESVYSVAEKYEL